MPNNDYANEPNQSRSEDIIQSILDNTEYDEEARSRIEYLLIELKNAIEGGGGGGGVTSYSPLTEKPKIDNHTLQAGNNSSSDLGLQTKLTFDSAPTESSTNPVTSGGVHTALATKANADNVYKLALSNADLLPANTDLDNVKTVGCYYVYDSTIVSTITHKPTENARAFRVTVELAAGRNRPRQIYQEFSVYDKYIRYETSNGTWAAWKKVEADLSTKQDTISDLSTIRSGAALGATAVQPVSGKGLSTNDYTTAEKTKLAGIADGAEVNEIVGIKVNNTTVNPDVNKVVNITVPTTAVDVSALPNTTKYAAALSLAINSSTFVMTGQLKDQNGDNLGTAQTIDLPLESVVVNGSYDSQTKKVVLTLQNGDTIEFSVADLVSGLQTELSASNKLNPAYIDYDSTHRAVSDTEKSTWNGKQNAIDSSHKLSADLVDDTNATNKFATAEELEQIQTNKNNISKDEAALVELVDGGAKNLSDWDGGAAATDSSFVVQNEPITLKKATYAISFDTTANSGRCEIVFRDSNGVVGSCTFDNTSSSTLSAEITLTADAVKFNIFTTKAATITNFMICTKAAWDISQTHQPYRPSYQELYEMVKALQPTQ